MQGLSEKELDAAIKTATLSASQTKATASTIGLGTAYKGLGSEIKATTASMWTFLTTTPVGWATLAVAAIGSIVTGVYAYNKAIDKAVDNAKENLDEVSSKYNEVTSKIEENDSKIKELEALRKSGNLSIVDSEDLDELKKQNEELRIRQQYLEKQKEISNQDIVKASKTKYNRDYGKQDVNDGIITTYKEELSKPQNTTSASSYLTGEGGSQSQSSSYAAAQQDGLNTEADTLAILIAKYQLYEEEKTKAIQAQDSESIEKYSLKLDEISHKLMENRTGLQGFRDDLSLTGEASSELDDVNYKLGLIDDTLLSKGKQLVEFINNESFSTQKQQLIELVNLEKLTEEKLTNSFPELDSYLEKNGLILKDLIGIVKTYKTELESLALDKTPNFSDIFSSLPIDKLEEYIALVKDGTIDEKTIGNYEELSEAILETGVSAEDALKAIKEYSEGFVSSAELTQGIQESYDLLTEIQTEVDKTTRISLDSLNSIAKQFPELTTATAEYAQRLITTADMMDLLEQAYDNDADAFRSAMAAKLGGNESFFSTIKENNQGLFTDLANAYGLDVDNWKTMAQAKAAIDQALIKDLSSAWSKYYKIVFDSVTGLASLDGGPDLSRASSRGTTVDPEVQRAWSAANNQKNKINQIMHTFNKAAEIEIEPPDFNGIGGKSGSKDSKGSKSKDQSEFDWMEQKITVIDSRVDKLKTNIESLVGYKNKNSMTDTAIDSLIEKMDVLQQMHDKYMEKAGNLGLGQEYIDKIQNGTIEIESVGDENLAKIIKEYQDLFEKAQNTNERIDDTQKAIKELNHSKLDNVINQFSQLTDIHSQLIDTEKQLLDLREKSGEYIFADDYISLSNKQLELIKQNADAYNVLESEMSKMNLVKGTDEWKKYNDQLQEYKNNMISAADAVEQYKDAMTDLAYKGLNDFKSAMDSVNGTISTMNDLIGDTNLVDDFGNLTERGLAQVALYAHQMSNSKQEAAEYAEAIKSLDDALDSGLITQGEYNSMLQDYTSSQESAIKSSKDARDAILSLVKDGIQAEIDAKKKLTDETKATLDAEKDLHDYQKSITEKQDNISRLQRAIASITSTDRESLRKKLELQNELSKALEELNELRYDHEIEQRKKALDEEYNSFEESKQKESEELDSNLDAQDKAINKYLDQVKNNYSSVYDVLKQYGDEYSLSAIENLTSPWESGTDAAGLCASAIGDAIANIQYEINGLDFSSLYDLAELMNQIGLGEYGGGLSSTYEDISGTGSWQQGQGGKWWYGSSNDDYASGGIYTINGKQYGFDDSGYMTTGWDDSHGDWRYFEPANGEMVKSEWRKNSNGDWYYLDKDGVMATDMAVKAKDGDGYYYLDSEGKWDNQKLDAEQVRRLGYRVGYRKGTRSATKGLHLMDEDGIGSEGILTNKGRLVQFNGGETVFNPKEMQNLYDIAQDPTRFITGLSGIQSNMIDYSKIQPVNREQKIEVNMNIGGVLDETTYRLMEQNMPDLLKRNMKQIAGGVSKDIQQELLGKSRR